MELIYQTEDSLRGDRSPFDKKLETIVQDNDVLVVSPYLSLEYVKRIEDVSSSHRIITDLNEWLPSLMKELKMKWNLAI